MRNCITIYLTAALLFLMGCQARAPKLDSKTMGRSTETHRWIIQYGYYPSGELAFVAFAGMRTPNEGFPALVTSGSHGAWLTKANGARMRLPSDVQLYEDVDGEYRESKERVGMDEFQAFMASDPKEYTIEALLGFVNSRRKGQAE